MHLLSERYNCRGIQKIDEFKLPAVCSDARISRTSCNSEKIRGPSGHVYEVKEFAGMCWFAESLREAPSEFPRSPVWQDRSNNGWYGSYGPENMKEQGWIGRLVDYFVPGPRESADVLYTFAAAMNSTS